MRYACLLSIRYSPAYLSDLTVYTPSRQLHFSADTQVLRIAHVKTKTFVQQSFSYCAPKQWNSVISDILHIQFSHAFKPALKKLPLHTIPQQQVISKSAAPPLSLSPHYIPSVNLHVCVCMHTGVFCAENNIDILFLRFYRYIFYIF